MPEQPVKRDIFPRPSSAREREFVQRALRWGVMALLFVAFFVLLLNLTLPWAAEGALIRSFGQTLQTKAIEADVQANPSWRLLSGRTDQLELLMEFDDNSLLALSLLRAQWGPSNVALRLMRQGKGSERDAEPNATELYWDETRLAAYLNRVQGDVLVSRVIIDDTGVAIYGSVALDGGRHNIYIFGQPKSDDLGRVVFTADEWRADGLVQTEQLKERLCEALSFEPDLSPLAWKVWAKQVVLSPGQMLVYGASTCCH